MRLSISHITTFTYDHLVSEAYSELRLKPLDTYGQHCLSFSLRTEPRDEILLYQDRFGNDVRHFGVIQPHQTLVAESKSEVLTPEKFPQSAEPLSPLDEYDYLMPTDYVTITPEVNQFTGALGDGGSLTERVFAILRAVHQALVYEKGATDVTTNAAQALALGKGVCQDFTHLMLASCRCQRIPARYVSGYLYNNGYSTATHAWVDVYLGEPGWISLDPTHNVEQTADYVRVAIGRDYGDVPPTRGVFVGNAREEMTVNVTVKAV